MTPFTIPISTADVAAVGPEIALCAFGILILLLDAFLRASRPALPFVALAGLFVANVGSRYAPGTWFSGAIETSELTRFVDLVAVSACVLAVLGGGPLLARDRKNQGEFYSMLLFSAAGLTLMVKGTDLLVVFVGLELMSLGLYVLAAWYRDLPESAEAGMKYFLMGALASTFFLFGTATIYGRTGTTSLTDLVGLASSHGLLLDPMVALGLVALVAALSFKLSLVPFHSWAPDVYQGMTTPGVAFLSTAPKAAALLVLVRVLHALAPEGLGEPWKPLLGLLAVVSILFGNVVALAQRDVKRMLAYSGIAQMGYAAIALATFTDEALEGLLVFVAGYLVTNVAAFLSAAVLSNGERDAHPLADLAGLGRVRPGAASILTLSMLSLAGLPPTVGFIGKLFVFRAAVEADLVWLAIFGIAGSLISVGYYFRVVYFLWMKEPSREVAMPPEDAMSGAAHLLVAAGMLVLGVFPRPLLDVARSAASALPLGLLR